MSIETITLNLRTRIRIYLFKGYITSSIYFRFTTGKPIDKVKKGQEINIHIPYKNKDMNCHYHKTIGCLWKYCNHILIMKCRKACLK
jgi:hypothetical protein